MYRLGITPWDRDEVPGHVVELADQISTPGRALDVGCGTGRDAVFLAKRGWKVTGIDGVPQAIESARNRASGEGVDAQWIVGDVTKLESLGLEPGFDLVLDRGCIHSLSDDGRARCAAGINALTGPGAHLLMFACQPRRLGLGPRGMTAEEARASFGSAWNLSAVEQDTEGKMPPWLGDARPAWYRLSRVS
jgi:SAM-dependent methyltransferase